MGYFYPPPPTFIGGAQPYAPRLGIVQSGPVPQPPPIRGPMVLATLGIIVSAWQPPPSRWQASPKLIQSGPLVVAPNPFNNAATIGIITASWAPEPTTVISLASAAGNIAATPSQPQPVTLTTLNLVIASWTPPFQMPPRGGTLAPLIQTPAVPSQPPTNAYGRIRLNGILARWIPPFQFPPKAGTLAPLIPPPVPIPPVVCAGGTFDALTPMPGLML